MSKKRQLLIFTLILAILVQYVQVFALQFQKNESNPNIYRAIGLGSFDIWRKSDLTWTNGYGPGSTAPAKATFRTDKRESSVIQLPR